MYLLGALQGVLELLSLEQRLMRAVELVKEQTEVCVLHKYSILHALYNGYIVSVSVCRMHALSADILLKPKTYKLPLPQ